MKPIDIKGRRRTRVARRLGPMVVFGALLVADADSLLAETIIYAFSGSVTSVDDPGGSLGGLVSPGTNYSGTFTYDTSPPDSVPGDTTVGFYLQSIPPNGFSVSIAGFEFNSSPAFQGSVTVYDDNFGLRDRLQLQTHQPRPTLYSRQAPVPLA